MKTNLKIKPTHPGRVLLEEFLEPMDMSQYHLAMSIKVPPRRINEIVHELRGITADTALRLSRFFGVSAQFWMNLQDRYELEKAEDLIGKKITKEIKPLAVTA
jgi:antitoxin HigA-1